MIISMSKFKELEKYAVSIYLDAKYKHHIKDKKILDLLEKESKASIEFLRSVVIEEQSELLKNALHLVNSSNDTEEIRAALRSVEAGRTAGIVEDFIRLRNAGKIGKIEANNGYDLNFIFDAVYYAAQDGALWK